MLETADGKSVEWRWNKTMTGDGRMFVGTKLDGGMSNRSLNHSDKMYRNLPANMHSGWTGG
jgi:hypothetical protein